MSGFEVDLAVLDRIARTFHHASADIDALGSSIPDPPDAGDGTAAVTGIVAHLVENASLLALGMAGAGDDVMSAVQEYRKQDEESGHELQQASEG